MKMYKKGFTLIELLVVIAIIAPLLTSFDPAATDTNNLMSGPGGAHLLGTDSAGRDILTRIFFGAQTTLISAVVVVVTALVVGLPSGLIAGYYGGKFDGIASWIANMLMSLPSIIVLLAVRAAFGPSIFVSMIVFGILIAPSFFRISASGQKLLKPYRNRLAPTNAVKAKAHSLTNTGLASMPSASDTMMNKPAMTRM